MFGRGKKKKDKSPTAEAAKTSTDPTSYPLGEGDTVRLRMAVRSDRNRTFHSGHQCKVVEAGNGRVQLLLKRYDGCPLDDDYATVAATDVEVLESLHLARTTFRKGARVKLVSSVMCGDKTFEVGHIAKVHAYYPRSNWVDIDLAPAYYTTVSAESLEPT